MTKINDINEAKEKSEMWHLRETAKRTRKTVDYIRKVLIYKTRNNDIVVSEFKRIVEESERRTYQIQHQIEL